MRPIPRGQNWYRTGNPKKPCDFNGAFEFQVPLRIHEGCERYGFTFSSGVGRLYAEDLIVKIEGAAGTMIVSV